MPQADRSLTKRTTSNRDNLAMWNPAKVTAGPGKTDMVAFVAFFLSTSLAVAALIRSADIHVIDGDTIRVHHQKPDVRFVGFNAPETRRAACDVEAELGAKATRRLRELVRTSDLDLNLCHVRARREPKEHRRATMEDVAER
jgi:endonuclease YncB( thermonuclease family)